MTVLAPVAPNVPLPILAMALIWNVSSSMLRAIEKLSLSLTSIGEGRMIAATPFGRRSWQDLSTNAVSISLPVSDMTSRVFNSLFLSLRYGLKDKSVAENNLSVAGAVHE